MFTVARVARQLSPATCHSLHVEAKLEKMGITLPTVSTPKGSYVLASRAGNLVYIAGHLPADATGNLVKGKVGEELSEGEAKAAARLAAINLMATLKHELGDLDRVKRVIKLMAFVNCADSFTAQLAVVNGASDVLLEFPRRLIAAEYPARLEGGVGHAMVMMVFGEKGRHARSAVGTNTLPLDVPVEIEAIVEVEG